MIEGTVLVAMPSTAQPRRKLWRSKLSPRFVLLSELPTLLACSEFALASRENTLRSLLSPAVLRHLKR